MDIDTQRNVRKELDHSFNLLSSQFLMMVAELGYTTQKCELPLCFLLIFSSFYCIFAFSHLFILHRMWRVFEALCENTWIKPSVKKMLCCAFFGGQKDYLGDGLPGDNIKFGKCQLLFAIQRLIFFFYLFLVVVGYCHERSSRISNVDPLFSTWTIMVRKVWDGRWSDVCEQ